MWVVANKLDNTCYRNVENGKINVDHELEESSQRNMTLGLEDGKQKEGLAYFK